jgi:hypothetical protein
MAGWVTPPAGGTKKLDVPVSSREVGVRGA